MRTCELYECAKWRRHSCQSLRRQLRQRQRGVDGNATGAGPEPLWASLQWRASSAGGRTARSRRPLMMAARLCVGLVISERAILHCVLASRRPQASVCVLFVTSQSGGRPMLVADSSLAGRLAG